MLWKFVVLHRDSDGFVLENPLAWCDVRIHDTRLLVLLDGDANNDGCRRVCRSQFMRTCTGAECS